MFTTWKHVTPSQIFVPERRREAPGKAEQTISNLQMMRTYNIDCRAYSSLFKIFSVCIWTKKQRFRWEFPNMAKRPGYPATSEITSRDEPHFSFSQRGETLKSPKTTLIVIKMWSYHWLPHEGLPFTKPKPCPWSRFQNFRGGSDRNLLPLLPSFNWISSQNVKEIVESSVYKKNSGWSMEELRIYRQVKYRKDGHIYLDVPCEC